MIHFLDGSMIVRGCRRIGKKVGAVARGSVLCGPKWEQDVFLDSRIVEGLGRVHPAEAVCRAVGKSRILGWLYAYGENVCAGRLYGVQALIGLFCGLMAIRMGLAGRYALMGLLMVGIGISLLLPSGGTLGGWIEGSFLGRIPGCGNLSSRGTPRLSVTLYLAFCGLAGGIAGWLAGMKVGLAAAAALAAFPIVFSIPPVGMAGLLCFLLPLCNTTVCWIMSVLTGISYLFSRAFGGLRGQAPDYLDVLLMMFPFFCLVSSLFSFDRADSLRVSFMWLGLFFCVFFIKRAVRTRRQLLAVLGALTAGAAITGLYGVAQYFSGMVNTTWTDTALFEGIELRVYSTFANPNVYGEYLLLLIPLVTALVFYARKIWQRTLLVAIDLLLLANMLLTYSRGCYVGIVLCALVFLWNYSKKWLGAAVVIGVPLTVLLIPESVAARILSIGNMSDSSTSYRMMIYIGTLLMLADYWLSGVGIGELAFNQVYPLYALSAIIAPHSHSLFFQSLVSFGLAGFLYLLLMLAVYQRNVKKEQRGMPRENRLLMLGFNALMWGFALQSIFDYTWYNYRVFQLFWIILVLGLTAAKVLREKADD